MIPKLYTLKVVFKTSWFLMPWTFINEGQRGSWLSGKPIGAKITRGNTKVNIILENNICISK